MKKTLNHFNIKQICDSGQCFRMSLREDGAYSIIAGDRYVEISQEGDQVTFSCDEAEYEEFWIHYFDLDTDYGKYIDTVDPEDEYLSAAVEFGDGIRILNQELWEMIVSFLISQQNNIPRIRKCINNICQKYGNECTNYRGETYYGFPTADKFVGLAEDALMECNLGYRSKYVVRTAHEFALKERLLSDYEGLSYEDAKQELLKLYGVGKKVADCICLFSLHHIDAFPIDTHIKQVLDREYAGGFPFDRYDGFAGVIQQYIFYYELNLK